MDQWNHTDRLLRTHLYDHTATMSKKHVQAHSQSYLWLKRLQLQKANQVIKSDAFSLSEMKS